MPPTDFLQGDGVWTGAEMARNPRWVKMLAPALLAQIDTALAGVQHLDWQRTAARSFRCPRRRPALHALLCRPIPRSRFGEEAGGETVAHELPGIVAGPFRLRGGAGFPLPAMGRRSPLFIERLLPTLNCPSSQCP